MYKKHLRKFASKQINKYKPDRVKKRVENGRSVITRKKW